MEHVELKDRGVLSNTIYKRPQKLNGITYKIKTPSGTAYITVNGDESNYPVEVLISIGKCGGDVAAMADTLARYITIDLQANYKNINKVIERIRGIKTAEPVIQTDGDLKGKVIYSLPDAFVKAILDFYNRYHKDNKGQNLIA